jgi:hypothetical protein
MRLGQLARKLGLKPSEVIEFLASRAIQIEENANYRVDDEHTRLVVEHFAPHLLEEEKVEEFVSQPEEPEQEQPAVVIEEAPESITSSEPIEVPEGELEQQEEPLPDVIRVPKIELSGLKVLGKIELPEKKKKEAPAEGESTTEDVPVKSRSNRPEHKQARRPMKNPLEVEREREKRQAEARRQEEAERKKQQRTQNYLKRVKSVTPARKTVNPPTQQEPREVMEETVEKPKGLWGKFKRWLFS